MTALKGTAHSSGAIEFSRDENPWAFRRMDDKLKLSQEKRIVFRPEVAPIEIEPYRSISEADLPWLERTRQLLNTAETVYLARIDNTLRFRQAVHETGVNQKLVVLGSQEEVDAYAKEYWQKLTYFFAQRHMGYKFDITSMTWRVNPEVPPRDKVELVGNLMSGGGDSLPHVTFDATGSTASAHIVGWRSTVKDGEIGKFTQEDAFIRLSMTNIRQPLVFCHDFRKTLNSHTFIFIGEKLDERLRKMLKKKRPVNKA